MENQADLGDYEEFMPPEDNFEEANGDKKNGDAAKK